MRSPPKMLRVGVVRPDRLDPWPDRSGQAPGLSGRPDRPAGLRQPCLEPCLEPVSPYQYEADEQ